MNPLLRHIGRLKPLSAGGGTDIQIVNSGVYTGDIGVDGPGHTVVSNLTLAAGDALGVSIFIEDSGDSGVDNPIAGGVTWGTDSWAGATGTDNWSVLENTVQGVTQRTGTWYNTGGNSGTNDLVVTLNDGTDSDVVIVWYVIRNSNLAGTITNILESLNTGWPYDNASVSIPSTGLLLTLANNSDDGTYASTTENIVQQDQISTGGGAIAGAVFSRRVLSGTETVNVSYTNSQRRSYINLLHIPE